MNEGQVQSLRGMLLRFASVCASPDATLHAQNVVSFIAGETCPWSRVTLAGHLTASGGHVEDVDATWRATAQREATEEAGLVNFISQRCSARLFDVDVHAIPARNDELAHVHYDLRFLFVADVDATLDRAPRVNLDEVRDCRWFALAELANDPTIVPSMRRMIELSIRRFPD